MFLNIYETYSQNKIYYVDNIDGNDNNNGTTEYSAWKTLYKISSIIFQADDKILLKRNEIFEGSLILHGSGTNNHAMQKIQTIIQLLIH